MSGQEKLLPQNIEAEQAVLGSLLIDPEALVEVAAILRAQDMYRAAHQVILQHALDLYTRLDRTPADLLTLTDELARTGKLDEVGGASYVTSLANNVPTSANAAYYARIVERTAVLRRLIQAAGKIAALAYNEPDADVALEQAEQLIFSIASERLGLASGRTGPVPLRETVNAFMDLQGRLEDMRRRGLAIGITTGYAQLNKALAGGMKPSDLLILAARPSLGKTAMALNIARNAARAGCAVLFFSLEMSQEQLTNRLVSLETGVDQSELAAGAITDEESVRVASAAGRLAEYPLAIDDTPGLSLAQMRHIARRAALAGPLDLVIVDYLQLMEASSGGASGGMGGEGERGNGGYGAYGGGRRMENRQQEVAAISRGLKALARELKVPILALSQLSRAIEQRQDKKPLLSDLRESGSIEQEADVVLFLHRDEVYNAETERQNIADVLIAKHRNGPLGTVSLYFKKTSGSFKELDLQREPPAGASRWAGADAARRARREDALAREYGLSTSPEADGPDDSTTRGERPPNDDF